MQHSLTRRTFPIEFAEGMTAFADTKNTPYGIQMPSLWNSGMPSPTLRTFPVEFANDCGEGEGHCIRAHNRGGSDYCTRNLDPNPNPLLKMKFVPRQIRGRNRGVDKPTSKRMTTTTTRRCHRPKKNTQIVLENTSHLARLSYQFGYLHVPKRKGLIHHVVTPPIKSAIM